MNPLTNLGNKINEKISDNSQGFALFNTLVQVNTTQYQSQPPFAPKEGGEYIYAVWLNHPNNNLDSKPFYIYAKQFVKPLKIFTGQSTTEYRIRAYEIGTNVVPAPKYSGRSKVSFDEALDKVRQKIFNTSG